MGGNFDNAWGRILIPLPYLDVVEKITNKAWYNRYASLDTTTRLNIGLINEPTMIFLLQFIYYPFQMSYFS